MRIEQHTGTFKVNAVAGTYVVLFGMNMAEAECDGLLGFSIHRTDHTENEAYYLRASKVFETTDPGFPPGSLYSTEDHPIQSFQWADYTAKPGHSYTYTITARKGTPENLTEYSSVTVQIETEDPESGNHDVYFNRGIAASQAYVRRFGNNKPEDVPNRMAFRWLSRGLNEALEEFIRSCVPGTHSLRIAAYEFNYGAFLDVVKEVLDTGVDIQIVYDARKDSPKLDNIAAVADKGLDAVSFQRSHTPSYISHNKFIVKLENQQPQSVWTGGTNFSEGGIYGHSNVADVIDDQDIAQLYLQYWEALSQDLESTPMKDLVESVSPLPPGEPATGTTVLFSPRKNLDALDWYSNLAMNANDAIFMTFAFGMNDRFKNVYQNGAAPFRLALMEKKTRSMKAGPERDAEEQKIQDLRNMPENVFAIGDFIRTNNFDGWVRERLTGLNTHVRYIHNKFMLLNPLTDDPIIISGSANFSDASTRRNDENMLVVRGDTRVADIYLGEFMRLFSHHAFRESLAWRNSNDPPKPLRTDDWWVDSFANTQRSTRRKYFARADG